MFFEDITEYEVATEIAKLDKNKASDIYNFPIRVIKQASDLLAKPMAMIFNESITKST